MAKIPNKKKIRVSFFPLSTLRKILNHAKDSIDLKKDKGVYLVPYDYGQGCISETGKTFKLGLKSTTMPYHMVE